MKTLKGNVIAVVMVLAILGSVSAITSTASAQTFLCIGERRGSVTYSDDDWFQVTLVGGKTYSIDLIVPVWADFDVEVYDENGNLVGEGTRGEGSDEEVFITPKWTGSFYIRIFSYDGRSGNYNLEIYRKV